MHYAKYQRGAVGSILLHSDRGIDRPDNHKHSNESIDETRTHLNYDLKNRNGLTAYEYYKRRIDDIANETKERTGKGIRKDAVTLCSWVLTAPKELPEEKLQDFFTAAYSWFEKRYGEDNIVTAAVHLDETSPHLHLQFTPIIVEKDGLRRLCAKDIETRKTLSTAHQELQKHLESSLGAPCNVLNGATVNGNKTIIELKTAECAKKLLRLEQKVTNEQVAGEIVEILTELKAAMQQKGFFGKANRKEQFDAVLELATKMQTAVLSVTQFTSAYTRQLEEVFDFSTAAVQKARKAFISDQKSREKKLAEKEKGFEAEKTKLMAQIRQKEQELNQRAEYLKFNEAHLQEAVDLQAEERAAEIARKTLCRVDKYAEYIKTSASFEKRYREHFGRTYDEDLERHSNDRGEER